METRFYGPADIPADDLPPAGHERLSLVSDDGTGAILFQLETDDGPRRVGIMRSFRSN